MTADQSTPQGQGFEQDWAESADRFASEERVRLAAESRRHERWRHQRSLDEADLPSLLRGATGTRVTLRLPATTMAGVLESVGAHLATVLVADGRRWVVLDAVETVEFPVAPVRELSPTHGPTALEVLEDVRASGADLRLGLRSGSTTRGRIVACGSTVVLLDHTTATYVAIDPGAIAWFGV
jgi:hypothetical protein